MLGVHALPTNTLPIAGLAPKGMKTPLSSSSKLAVPPTGLGRASVLVMCWLFAPPSTRLAMGGGGGGVWLSASLAVVLLLPPSAHRYTIAGRRKAAKEGLARTSQGDQEGSSKSLPEPLVHVAHVSNLRVREDDPTSRDPTL